VAQDRLLEFLELRSRLEPEFGDERLPRVRIRIERLGLTAAAVEREHELSTQTLAQRLRADERRQLAYELRVPRAGEIGVDPRFECRKALLLQRPGGVGRERLVCEIGERPPTPKRERVPERARRILGRVVAELAAPSLDKRAETLEVDLLGGDLEGIARRSRDENAVRLEGLSESGDMLLKRRGGIRRRPLTPEFVDQAVAGDRLAGAQDENREDAALPRATQRKLPLTVTHLERAENAEIERARQIANVPRSAVSALTAA